MTFSSLTSSVSDLFSGLGGQRDAAGDASEAAPAKRLSFKEKLQRDPFEKLAREEGR
ncbi:MAG: hypothetical protein AAFM92_13910 [Pseudomonadota bacterium]